MFAAVIILFTSWTVYYTLPFPLLFEGILALYILFRFGSKTQLRQRKMFVLFFLLSLWYFRPMGFDIKGLIFGVFRSFVISALFLLPYISVEKIIRYLKILLAVIVGFGVIAHILRLLGIISFPLIDIVFRDNRYYEVYFLHVYQSNTSMRFASIFDEPGYLGTVCGFILAVDGFNFKKITNIILFIGGVVSLSFAFYVMAFIALLLIAIKGKKYGVILVAALSIWSIFLMLPDFFTPIIERPELLSIGTGNFEDSRGGTASVNASIKIISAHGFFNSIIGNGYDAPLYYFKENTNSLASSSIFRLIFQMGYLGLISILLFVISFTGKTFNSRLFSLLFILSLYQRPHVFQLIFVVLLVYSFNLSEENKL